MASLGVPGCPVYITLLVPVPDLVMSRPLVAGDLIGVIPFSTSPVYRPVCGVSDNLIFFMGEETDGAPPPELDSLLELIAEPRI
jgi:hypothetical protein